ncbi:MAG TPA: hypothetical protein VN892_04585, partial [Solirubrobacteraceae bacterium]|nr:hypothetical protein [Solirubrobacteraceae bacterium]
SQLLAYRAVDGWRELTAEEVNAYLKRKSGGPFTAKDFRTWNATVLAATALAGADDARGRATREREVPHTRLPLSEVGHTQCRRNGEIAVSRRAVSTAALRRA